MAADNGNEFGVVIEVESIKAPCSAGLSVGDRFVIQNYGGSLVMENFDGCCPELFNVAFPIAMAMAHGGRIRWEDERGKARSVCPDGHCIVQVALSRIPEKDPKEA